MPSRYSSARVCPRRSRRVLWGTRYGEIHLTARGHRPSILKLYKADWLMKKRAPAEKEDGPPKFRSEYFPSQDFQHIEPDSWIEPKAFEYIPRGFFIVVNTADVHEKLGKYLKKLREEGKPDAPPSPEQ